jgi:S2P endopeptidase
MSPFFILLVVLAAIYGFIYVFDALMRSFDFSPYPYTLSRLGVEIKLFQVRWYTTGLNRLFTRIGSIRPNFWNLWFSLGAWVSALLIVPAMFLLVQTLVTNLISLFGSEVWEEQPSDRIVLQPVLPGVNMPLSELPYYFITLLVCSVIHEAGHAVAAVNEDIRVLGFGMFVFFALPAAHVDLPTDQLLSLRSFRQLKVFSAGVWHNVVLAVFAYVILFSVPFLSSPLFTHGSGVAVSSITPGSAVRGPTGLRVGDGIVAINDCPVNSKLDWRYCLSLSIERPAISVCMKRDLVAEKDQSVIVTKDEKADESAAGKVFECCDTEKASSNLCFMDVVGPPSEGAWKGHACLPVRTMLEKSHEKCNTTAQCGDGSGEHFYCMRASLYNSSRLLHMRRSNGVKLDFLFVGNPAEIYQTVEVTDYVPRSPSALVRLPSMIELLCYYMASFSGALAVLNVVPCFMLDGQHMTRVLVDICCNCYDASVRSVLALTFTIVGTVLLVSNVIVGLWQMT